MATKAEIKAQIDKLTKDMESAPDDEVELLVERDGMRTTLKGTHARRLLKKWGLDEDETPDGDGDQGDGDGDQGDGDGDGDGDDPPASGHRFFK